MQEQEVILKRRMSLQLVSIVALLGAVLIPASGVNASGYENIGGFAPTSQTNWYTTIRFISDPSTPGPAVAFYEYYGPDSLALGAWGCGSHYWPWGGPYIQAPYAWSEVADGLAADDAFCMTARAYGTEYGNFNGDLSWD